MDGEVSWYATNSCGVIRPNNFIWTHLQGMWDWVKNGLFEAAIINHEDCSFRSRVEMQRLWVQRHCSWVWLSKSEDSLPPSSDNHIDLPDCKFTIEIRMVKLLAERSYTTTLLCALWTLSKWLVKSFQLKNGGCTNAFDVWTFQWAPQLSSLQLDFSLVWSNLVFSLSMVTWSISRTSPNPSLQCKVNI